IDQNLRISKCVILDSFHGFYPFHVHVFPLSCIFQYNKVSSTLSEPSFLQESAPSEISPASRNAFGPTAEISRGTGALWEKRAIAAATILSLLIVKNAPW